MDPTRRELFAAPLAAVPSDPLGQKVEELTRLVAVLSLKLTEADERVSELSKTAPPIGTVIMWWGDRAGLPPGWEVCDGGPVRTAGALLAGAKPNLVGRFPKGAAVDRKTAADLARAVGGSNNLPALKIAGLAGLRTDHRGNHVHALSVRLNSGDSKRKGCEVTTHDTNWNDAAGDGKGMRAAGDHQHEMQGYVGKEDGINADGDDTTGANQPAFQEVFFLIRTK